MRRGLSHCDDGFCERVVESPPGFGRRLRWFADFISVDCTAGRHPFRGCWLAAAPALLSDETGQMKLVVRQLLVLRNVILRRLLGRVGV